MSTYISTRNYYDLLLGVLNIVYLIPEDGYYGRNMLHVLRGLTISVVVDGKTYVCEYVDRRLR